MAAQDERVEIDGDDLRVLTETRKGSGKFVRVNRYGDEFFGGYESYDFKVDNETERTCRSTQGSDVPNSVIKALREANWRCTNVRLSEPEEQTPADRLDEMQDELSTLIKDLTGTTPTAGQAMESGENPVVGDILVTARNLVMFSRQMERAAEQNELKDGSETIDRKLQRVGPGEFVQGLSDVVGVEGTRILLWTFQPHYPDVDFQSYLDAVEFQRGEH